MSNLASTPAMFQLSAQRNIVYCAGDWTLDTINHLENQLNQFSPTSSSIITFDGSAIGLMDTAGAWLLYRTYRNIEQTGQSVLLQNFQPAHMALLTLVMQYVPISSSFTTTALVKYRLNRVGQKIQASLEDIGRETVERLSQIVDFLAFIGEVSLVFVRALLSPLQIRWQALFVNLQAAGVTALPIIGLMAFLIGIVIAYQGGTQLQRYGANILIVDLVGVTLLRELAPLMTAIIVAGRSGSAYAAQIGTMRVTDEIDALRTLGIAPMELLVLPKLLALIIALPLLSAFADILGLLGGMLIANLAFGVSIYDFIDRLSRAVAVHHYLIGIGKAPIFAAVIASVGCYQGFQVKGGADSVGRQVTTSVVQGIFLVIVFDAIFSIIFSWIGI